MSDTIATARARFAWSLDRANVNGTTHILVTGTELVNALETARLTPSQRAALDAFRDAMEGNP